MVGGGGNLGVVYVCVCVGEMGKVSVVNVVKVCMQRVSQRQVCK